MTQNIGLKQKFIDALFGVKPQSAEIAPTMGYGEAINGYLDSLPKQDYMQGLYNQPKEVGLAPNQIREGVANGLNFGVPQIAQKQKELGIAIPKTGEDIALAQEGQFNLPVLGTAGVSEAPRRGGLLRDLASGYNENVGSSFNPTNLEPSNKSVATRIGEGLGTFAKVLDSPLGRGALAYGLSNYVGDTNPLEQGLTAALGRQQSKMANEAYRKDLLNTRLNSLLNSNGYADLTPEEQLAKQQAIYDEINGISGNLTDEVYERMQNAQLARDNADYKRMYYDTQLQDNKNMMAYRMMQAQNDANKNAMDNYYKGQQIAQGWKKIENEANEINKNNNQILSNLNAIDQQLTGFENLFNQMPGKLESNTLGNLRSATGFETPLEANFNSQKTLLFNKIARDLGGEKGVLSDQDIKNVEKTLPKLTDSYQQKLAKMKAVRQLLEIRMAQAGYGGKQQSQVQPQTKSKYKVRVIK